MKVVYISGPYNSIPEGYDRHHGIQRNIVEASRVAAECWKKGWAVICPHLNTAGFHNLGLDEEIFLKGCIEMVKRCDAILLMEGWEKSEGAERERLEALLLGKPVYHVRDGIPDPQAATGVVLPA